MTIKKDDKVKPVKKDDKVTDLLKELKSVPTLSSPKAKRIVEDILESLVG